MTTDLTYDAGARYALSERVNAMSFQQLLESVAELPKLELYGFMGKRESGKSYAAEIIRKYLQALGGRFVRVFALADPLKELTCGLLQIPKKTAYEAEGKAKSIQLLNGLTVGRMLQLLGTEGCREQLGDDVWVALLLKRIYMEHALRANKDVTLSIIVPDVRFYNEATALLSAGCNIICIDRPQHRPSSDGRADAHVSEALDHYVSGLSGKDRMAYICNDGDETFKQRLEMWWLPSCLRRHEVES